jgi:hypothetical protein
MKNHRLNHILRATIEIPILDYFSKKRLWGISKNEERVGRE